MSVYETKSFADTVRGNSYVGRGIVTGLSQDGDSAVAAYFIMGRSVNSRNRIFIETDDGIRIEAFDPSKLADPSLIIYTPVRAYKKHLIITNGDQTDTVYNQIERNEPIMSELRYRHAFLDGLATRDFEPDAPNFTPRISAMINVSNSEEFTYIMHICKSSDAEGSATNRYSFSYNPIKGLGHFIHTYNHDGNPIPTFTGEPERVLVPNDIDEFTEEIWNSLDADNKVALYVCYVNLRTGEKKTQLRNINK